MASWNQTFEKGVWNICSCSDRLLTMMLAAIGHLQLPGDVGVDVGTMIVRADGDSAGGAYAGDVGRAPFNTCCVWGGWGVVQHRSRSV